MLIIDNSIICSTTEEYRDIIVNKQFYSTYFIPQPLSSYKYDSKYNYSYDDECNDYDSSPSYSEPMNQNYDTSFISNICSNWFNISFATITMTLECGGCKSRFFTNIVIDYDYDDYNYSSYSNYSSCGVRCDGANSCINASIPNCIVNTNNNSNVYFSGIFAVGAPTINLQLIIIIIMTIVTLIANG